MYSMINMGSALPLITAPEIARQESEEKRSCKVIGSAGPAFRYFQIDPGIC